MKTLKFDEPTSVEDAESRRLTLSQAVVHIQACLGDRNRLDPDTGKRLDDKSFWQWRARAKYALGHKLQELTFLKDWLRRARDKEWAEKKAAPRERLDVPEAVRQLRAASYDIVHHVNTLGGEVSRLRGAMEAAVKELCDGNDDAALDVLDRALCVGWPELEVRNAAAEADAAGVSAEGEQD